MYRQLPNHLTLLRLVLAGVFFLILNQYRYPNDQSDLYWLSAAIVIFVLAALSDVLDGHLARKWHVESAFGRVMDPFCDKVLVLGAFIFLAGPRFAVCPADNPTIPIGTVSGVYPWMITLILARELLVTSIRGQVEEKGIAFGANRFGKWKMAAQSAAIPLILVIVGLDPKASERGWLIYPRDAIVYGVVAITILSGIPYVTSAIRAFRGADAPPVDQSTNPRPQKVTGRQDPGGA